MALRKIKKSDFIGKMIKNIKNDCHNVIVLTFDDGSKAELWAESEHSVAFGVPGIFIEDDR